MRPSSKMAKEYFIDRFNGFLGAQIGAEAIDLLDLTKEQAAADHADYFLQARHIVVGNL